MLRSPMSFGDLLDVAAFHDAARRVLRRVQDDQFGAVVDEPREFVDVEGEVALFAQLDGHRASADVVDHRLVDRKAGIGIDDFISLINK